MPDQTRLPVFIVDAFSTEVGAGNAAAVCLLNSALSDRQLRTIAAEFNQSETAFLQQAEDGSCGWARTSCFGLRWFTPSGYEAPLCGHGTIAAAVALVEGVGNSCPKLRFQTLSGELTVARTAEGYQMQLPRLALDDIPSGSLDVVVLMPACRLACAPLHADPAAGHAPCWAVHQPSAQHGQLARPVLHSGLAQLRDDLGLTLQAVLGGQSLQHHAIAYNAANRYLLVEAACSPQQLQDLPTPSQEELLRFDSGAVAGVIVTCKGDGKPYTFVSRFFAPWAGILEDPVTGSAHALLAPYWARRLGSEGPMHARQCSKRGGELGLQLQDEAVRVSAQAVLVLNGSMALAPA